MTDFKPSNAMVEAAMTAYESHDAGSLGQLFAHAPAMQAAIEAAINASGLVERIAELERAGKNLTDACHASIRITGIHYTPVISTRFNRAVEAMVEALNKDTTND